MSSQLRQLLHVILTLQENNITITYKPNATTKTQIIPPLQGVPKIAIQSNLTISK